MKNSRRKFLKDAALLGATPMLARAEAPAASEGAGIEYHRNDPDKMIFSVCLGCNTGCPTKLKIEEGTIVKIDGSPYTPWTRVPHVAYATPLAEAARLEGAICPKGQAGMMTVYDPYRLRKVLKRDGPRGSMRWKTIDFHQAVNEIVDGGRLFANLPGEESREVEGLKALRALREPKLADEMSKAVAEIWKSADKKTAVAAFREKFKDHLHLLIDPEHPDFGPKNNQFLWIHGRLKGGRSEFFKRFVQDGLGSANFHGHTTVCQGSLYFAGKAMSEQWTKDGWAGGEKFFWQADQSGAEFIIFVGSSPFEANYPPLRTPNITEGLTSGRLKIAVVDPRFSKTAAKAWKWIPARPGTEGALALGMIRWILENGRHDVRYLSNANKAAAAADGEPTWSNACWLVKEDGTFLRSQDKFVAIHEGRPVSFDPNDVATAAHGDLLFSGEVEGRRVRTSLRLLLDEATRKTVEQWAEICGIAPADIVDLAREFTSHGKKAAADAHRGVSQHTNGFYNCLAWNSLNLLIGNYDWRGGMVKASTYKTTAGAFDFANPDRLKTFGLGLLRERKFEETTLFDGVYPAKRPWFPNATDIYQELLPSAGSAYPYPVKALLLYMGTPGYSLPAGNTQLRVLADLKSLPLFVASDIVIGESSMYADYIIPDLAFYERWEFHGSHPNNIWKVQPVRQPVIAPLTETVTVFGEPMPISLEAFMLAVAERMKLPGFGGELRRPEDFYLRGVANIAVDGTPVAEASDEELALFEKARRHLPPSVFDLAKWKAAAGPHWKRVVTVLNRGGRYEDYEKAFDGALVKNRYGKQINLYCEKVAKTKDSMTGKPLGGVAAWLPISDSLGRPFGMKDGDLHLITHREIFQTKSRTAGNPWLRELQPENSLLVSVRDARRLGLRTGDRVRVVSDSNPEGVWDLPNSGKRPMIGRVQAIQGMRPGVVSFSLGHGHWAYGACDAWIDGSLVPGDPLRGAGVHANAAMATDPHLKDVCLQDLVGGSVSFYDSPVRLVKEP
ncbi:MAG: tetrathionate reductase subunit [Planctomycetota bacterium]|nr:MAG: tetrathionate reductase subunit [Planctomycetota bacterium]